MSRALRQAAVSTPLVPALLRYAAARGLDAEMLAARFALAADTAARDDVAVEPAAIGELIEAVATQLAEPFLALRLPAELPLRSYGLGELAARAAPTLRDSLRLLAPHVHPAMACDLVEPAGALAEWHQATPRAPRGIGRYAHEYGLAYVLAHVRAVLGAPLPVARVWFAHARPRAVEPLARWFGGAELAFGAADSGLAFARGELERAPVTADPRLAATVAELAPRVASLSSSPATTGELASRVAAIVRDRCPDATTADDAAALLHLSARTLQRRLESEATTFSAVFDAAREALARELLRDAALPLGEVAYRLGFADAATFSRAFKRWTGTPPGRFRGAR
nr:AraC family transcriptional regulator ligand-binding domain-containing protein [Kofleriaceae bacterium]